MKMLFICIFVQWPLDVILSVTSLIKDKILLIRYIDFQSQTWSASLGLTGDIIFNFF